LEEELESRDTVNILLSMDIEALAQVAKVSADEEVVVLKQALAGKALAEGEALSQRRRADEAVALTNQGWKHDFKDALAQVEFFQAPFKVDRSKVYLEQEVHRSVRLEDQPIGQGTVE